MLLTDAGLVYRGIRPLQKLGELAGPLAGLSLRRAPERLKAVPPDAWAGDPQKGRDMIAGVFCFAGQAFERENLSWAPDGASAEWLSALHGFEWLRDLRAVGGERARRMAREMVANWLDRHAKPDGSTAWDIGVVGARVCAWMSFHDFFCATADEAFRAAYFTGLARQARHLSKSLPGKAGGIALMKAFKGLAYAGLALDGGEERLEQGFQGILRQIREQILPDGGHVSRNPQVTFEFLQCLVDLRTALTAASLPMPDELQHAIDRVAPAVRFFRHGDGTLPHFNGGQEGNAHICDAALLHSGARGKAMQSMPHSGYERIQQGRASIIMDTGSPTQAQGVRAHAGLLSFEYGFGRERVIVNCGSASSDGVWRHLLRGTAAHSTLTVDSRNAFPFDDGGLPAGLPDVRARRQEDDDIAMIEASHNGYLPRLGLMHRRCLRLRDGGEALQGEDQLIGRVGVPFALRFHLHPAIQAVPVRDGKEILLRARSGTGWRFAVSGDPLLALEDSVYSGEGDTPRRTQQIVLHAETSVTATTVSWELRREKI